MPAILRPGYIWYYWSYLVMFYFSTPRYIYYCFPVFDIPDRMWYGDNRFPTIIFAPNQGFPTIVLFANSGPSLSRFSLKCKLLWLIFGWSNGLDQKEGVRLRGESIKKLICDQEDTLFCSVSVFTWSFWNIKALYWETVLSCLHNRAQDWEIELLSQSQALMANKS